MVKKKTSAASSGSEAAVAAPEALEPSDRNITLCARAAHAAVEALNKAHNELTLSWGESRASCEYGVRRLLANPNETPEENHQAWMAFRAEEGWVYGPIKDPVKMTHPCMVPYDALPTIQQAKDLMFMAIVRTFFGL